VAIDINGIAPAFREDFVLAEKLASGLAEGFFLF